MDYIAYFDFDDGSGEHGPYPLRIATPDLHLCSDSFHHAVSQYTISFIPTLDYMTRRAAATGFMFARILDDGVLVFKGLVAPTDSWSSNGVALDGNVDISDIQLEVLDYSSYLDYKIKATDAVAWQDNYLCDPANHATSIVHRLLALCGIFSGALFEATASDATILHGFSLDEGTVIADALDALLWQHGLVLTWDVDHFETFRWMINDPVPTMDLDEDIVMTDLKTERVERDADSVEVKWYKLKDKADCLLYMADLPFGADNQRSGYPIQPGLLWPEEANPDILDPDAPDPDVWCAYDDTALSTRVNSSGSRTSKNTDFTQIVLTKNQYIDSHCDAGIVPAFDPVFENKRAHVAYQNPTAAPLDIFYCDIYGDVIYRAAENSVVKNTVDTPKKPLPLTAEFIHEEVPAANLACFLAYFYGTACWRHTARSETLVAQGTIVGLKDPYSGLDTTAIIVGRSYDPDTLIYVYRLISLKPVTIDPTASYQAILPEPKTGDEDPRQQAQRAGPGATGPAGLNNAPVVLYKRSATAPALPTVASTYTFATGILTGQNNGWTQAVPASDGNPLYATSAVASSAGATDTIAAAEWAATTKLVQDGASGATGAAGLNVAPVFLYKRSATAPALPSVASTFTFATGILTGQNNGWTQAVPATDGNPLWVTNAAASSAAATDSIAAAEWSAATKLVQDGATGPAGLNNAPVTLYKRSATAPALPTTVSTYTFATGTLTGQDNGWTQAVPATDGNPLWATAAVASSSGATDTIAAAEWAAVTKLVQDGATGATGAAGLNVAPVFLYKRSATAPALPSVASTFTFATGILTGQNNGWTQAVPASDGNPLYVTNAAASSAAATDSIAAAEWSAATKLVQDGIDGTDGSTGPAGLNNAPVILYKRSATAPALPTTASTYTFATGVLSGQNNGWTQTVPASDGNPLYATSAVASSATATDSIAAAEWAATTKLVQDGATGSTGAAGLSVAPVFLYKRSATAPALPSVASTFTFATGILTGQNNGWTQAVPATDGNPLWVTNAAASSNTATDSIAAAEWSAASKNVQDGTDGDPGLTGPQGQSSLGCGAKLDYSAFLTAGGGYVYLHGFTTAGVAADVDGFIYLDNASIPVTHGAIRPNVVMDGYVVLPVAGGAPLAAYYQLSGNKFRSIINGALADLADASYVVIGEIATAAAADVESVTLYPRAKRIAEVKTKVQARYIGVADTVASGDRSINIYGFTGTYLFTTTTTTRIARPGDCVFARGGTLVQSGATDSIKALRVFDGYEWAAPTTEMYPVYRNLAGIDLAGCARVYHASAVAIPADVEAFFDFLVTNEFFTDKLAARIIQFLDSVGSLGLAGASLAAGDDLIYMGKNPRRTGTRDFEFAIKEYIGNNGLSSNAEEWMNHFQTKKMGSYVGAVLALILSGQLYSCSGVYSNPGTIWNSESSPLTGIIRSIGSGNGVSVSVGDGGKIARSTDGGVTWGSLITNPFGTSTIYSVAYGNGVWIAVSDGGKIARSTDGGVTWGSLIINPFGTSAIHGVAYGNGVLIAVSAGGKIARSTDGGVTWGSLITNPFGTSTIYNVAYGNGVLIAVSDGGKIARSTDGGVTWGSLITNPFGTSIIYNVAYGNGVWITVGFDSFENGEIARSTDGGVTWGNLITNPFGTSKIYGAAYGNGIWITVGDDGKIARSTDGGVTWAAINNDMQPFGSNGFFLTVESDDTNSCFIVVGYLFSNSSGIIIKSNWLEAGAGIVIRGSNSNGEYIKFSDGTMICTGKATINFSNATIASVRAAFPAAFANTDGITIVPILLSNSVPSIWTCTTGVETPTTTDVGIWHILMNGALGTGAVNVGYLALGRCAV